MQNIIDIYNTKHVNHSIKAFLGSDKLIKERQPSKSENSDNRYFTYNLNHAEDLAVWHNRFGVLEILSNGYTFTPFGVLVKYKFNGAGADALNSVDLLINKDKIPYIRVASNYYKVLKDKELISFKKDEMRQDYGSDIFSFIRKYDKFGVFPDNLDYRESVGNILNTYHRPTNVSYRGNDFKGIKDSRIKWSMIMMNHIFGDMVELGLEYMQILWVKPKQMLPILTLGSVERQTGKTTFSNWLNDIFGDNHVSLGLEDMKGDFNHFFAEKLVITIEETMDESHKLVNKLKRISTANKMLVNPKGIKQYVVDFYGKLVILTNSPDSFLKIESEEIRFWVLSIPTLNGKGNHNISDDLRDEIPFFLRLLEDMEIKSSRSRMWFHPDEIITEGLVDVQKESKNSTQKEILYLFNEEFREKGMREVYFNASDIKNVYFRSNNLVTRNYIMKVLMEFAESGEVNYSDKKMAYTSSVGDGGSRVGKCFWVEYDDITEGDVPF